MAITKTLVDWAASTMRSMRPEGTDAVAGPPGLPAPGVPSRIGRFLVIKPIGSGAAGVVYAAYDPELDRQVAIKCLRSAVRDPAAGERLRREARSLARLSHPNVVTVHDVGAVDAAKAAEGQDTCFFIAMELVDGMSLGAWLLKETRPWREVIDLLVQAGHGLAAAHGAGLLHRDFKPENVLVTSDGRAQVADFGLACAVNNPASEHGTGAATTVARLVGTPAYMAPETMEQPADERSDQFSYCATLYEALFGVLPHSGKGLVPLWNAKVHGELTPITDRRGVPRWLEEAVVKGLSPNPVDRWESLDELIAVLERPSRRRKISALAAAALLAAGLAAGSGVTTAINGVNSTICDAAPEPWRGVWDDGRRDELRRAFAESPVGFAGDTWDRVSDGLDAYVERWNASREAICREQRTESVGDLDLHRQMACITERQEEVRVLVNILMKAEPTVIEQASAAIDGLDSPNDCRADGALEARGVETGRSLVLRRHLAAVRSHHAVGDYEHAVELAAAVTADVRELGHTSLLADALFDLGRTLHSVGDLEGSIEAYEEATRVAVAHHHYSVAIRALIHTGQHNASTGDFAASENRMNEAAVLLERLPGSIARGIKPSLWIAYGRHYLERGEYVRAQVQFKRARAALVRLGETESGRYARATANLGSSHYRESELAEARKAYEEELELRQELHGAAHPKVAAVLQRL
ncbi:MAG: serine/threonine-protein kinase, partial [Acidobacteriota bacterium]